MRARIVLACADGKTNRAVAREVGTSPQTVCMWRGRFQRDRLDGLADKHRSGRPPTISSQAVERVLVKTLEETPKDATRWSTRRMAEEVGLSRSSVHRIWQAFEMQPRRTPSISSEMVERVLVKTLEETPKDAAGWSARRMAEEVGLSRSSVQRIWQAFELQPHRTNTFKIRNDPLFVDKVWDITGLYLNPPEAAAVLCVDEKGQVQAGDRTHPILPIGPRLPERRMHDYERHRTTTLLDALDVASGKVMEQTHRRHRAVELEKFLERVDHQVPAELSVHLVLDNYRTHKTPEIRKWLLGHPRFVVHFTTTYSSWMNVVERWFAELTEKWGRRGTHGSARELEASIREWIATWNEGRRAFVWTKSADEIFAT